MAPKRVLIVDDDKSILRMLEFGLKKLGPDYEIITSSDIFNAMALVEEKWFELLIIDYMMPVMTGVDLARAVRRMSPDTQIVLMTAYGTSKLRHTTDSLKFDGYINKPFNMEQLRTIVRQTTQRPAPVENGDSKAVSPNKEASTIDPAVDVDKPDEAMSVSDHLHKLHVNAGVRAVLLINAKGKLIQVVGQINRAKVDNICTQVAKSFFRPAELSSLLDNRQVFKANFYEGDSHNLYVCDVNGKFLLAVVFDVKLRPGVVWFYSKQTATALSFMV